MDSSSPNRWVIAVAGIVMQVAPGAVYAWSVFRTPLTSRFLRTISEVTLAFTICILRSAGQLSSPDLYCPE